MRSAFFLIPAALIAAAPATAKTYMTVRQAQARMFPGATLKPQFTKLDQWQASAIARASDAAMHSNDIKAWRASSGGWFVLDQVKGKDDWVSYAVALDDTGAVRQVEILECLSDYDAITMPEWRAQFVGKKHGDAFDRIETISGATLSSRHLAEGVKRVVETYAIALKPGEG
jgi:hypothetical protein